ncbi:MAG: DUF2892 domain-containing protein [Devosia sp.]|uniref:YgaP family membrane protein n=1 Tax=Devosia sp. 66-22 TaxID=1895753 RepID=UPI000927B7AF|nr:DUF2892 domain-containing protein [Devosia sp. 66-22]MBN9348079.1 DUF2892 domain-containing protein [Devosia sp.]OJX46588.1 MAG: hypothetical protein BGO81_03905 [Devosia sp. 66-22]
MPNVGNIDRIIRAILGIVLVIVPFVAGWPTLGVVAGVVAGAVLLGTAAFSFCPIYAVLGLSSKRRHSAGGR